MYVPLGGSKSQAWSMWVIFSFIGLWHDLQTRWLAWALLNCLFFTLEMLVIRTFSKVSRHFNQNNRLCGVKALLMKISN